MEGTRFFCVQERIAAVQKFNSLKKEFLRKTIHVCTAFVPVFLHFAKIPTVCLLASAGIFYTAAERARLGGREIPLVSAVTAAAARKRDENKFVLGPVTLVMGIVACALLWSEGAAAVGILSLAFGDGLASLAGKTFGRVRIPLTRGKTAAGSLTCFFAIFVSAFLVSGNSELALFVAVAGSFIEVLPLKDFDNLLIPIALGGISEIFY